MRKSTIERIAEEKLYEIVVEEMKRNEKREGLWAKAIVEANGDRESAQAVYIKLRVQALKDEIEVAQYAEGEVKEKVSENFANKPKIPSKYLIYFVVGLILIWLVLG